MHLLIKIYPNISGFQSVFLCNCIVMSVIKKFSKKKFLKLFIFLSLVFVVSFVAKTQEYSCVHYTPTEGLVQSQILCFFQDSKGFLWLGTKGGVSRFNGLNFKNFTINEGLASNFVHNIIENKSGNIIIITNNGFSCIVNKKVVNFYCNISGFNYNNILDVKETNKNEWEILYFSDSSFRIINFKNGIFSKDESKNNILENYRFKADFRYENKKMNSHDDDCFFAVDKVLYKLQNYKISKILKTKSDIKYVLRADNNCLYFLENNILYKLKNDKAEFFHDLKNIDNKRFASLMIDKKGKLYYIDNENHLHIGSHTDYYKQSFGNRCSIDKDNILWLWGEEGLFKIQSQLFINFISDKCKINPNIWCISEDKDKNIYFGSYEGSLVKYKNAEFEEINLKKMLKPTSVNLHFYMGSSRDKHGNMYLAMPELHQFDGNNFKKIEIENVNTVYSSLFTFIDTANQKFFAATSMGLLIKEQDKKAKVYKIFPGNKKNKNIVCIVKDKLGRYWLGGFKNISILDGNKVIHLPNKNLNFKFGGNAMHVDYRGNIWIGNENGLFLYDYHKFTKIENPYFNAVTGFITEIDNTHLLIGNMNNLGIMYLNNYYITNKAFFKIYNKYNGFWGAECGQNGVYKDTDNNFWIPANDRVVKFIPTEQFIELKHPNLIIDEINILDKRTLKTIKTTTYNENADLKLDYYQNNIRIDYLAVNTTAPEKIRFKYFMDGYDNDWSEETSQKYAIYNNMPPGKYSFHILVKNEDDIWNTLPESIKIYISRPFWQTAWFQAFIVLLILASGSFVTYIYNINKRKKQIEKINNDKKITELKLQSLKGQMDPHFTFNVINTIASIIYKGQKEEAIRGFTKFSNLLRNVITSPETSYRTVEQELDFVRNYLELEKFRFKDKFDYEIELSNNVNKYQNIPKMLIQTHVENAVKHGIMHLENKKGKIQIILKATENESVFVIEDNGIGRLESKNKSNTSTGLGLKIVNAYIELFNKYNKTHIKQTFSDLYDENKMASGTMVIIIIPKNFNCII